MMLFSESILAKASLERLLSSSASGAGSKMASRECRRFSISVTSVALTPRSCATASVSSADSQARLFFALRRLKNSLRCALVVATLTMRQFFSTNSWISARIQWTANETSRTSYSGSKRLTAFMRPTLPSWIRSFKGRP